MIKIIVVLFSICNVLVSGLTDCPKGWHQYHTSCFLFKQDNLVWDTAQTSCQNINARLAEVHTKGTGEYLKTMVTRLDGDWWLGAKDDLKEGHWRWTSGDLIGFTDWGRGEPDNANDQDCLQLYKTLQYHWDDIGCDTPRYYICETRINGVSEGLG